MLDFRTFGFLLESLAARDLRVYVDALGGTVRHYHDESGLESDFIIDLDDGRWAAVEVKKGVHDIDEGAGNLNTRVVLSMMTTFYQSIPFASVWSRTFRSGCGSALLWTGKGEAASSPLVKKRGEGYATATFRQAHAISAVYAHGTHCHLTYTRQLNLAERYSIPVDIGQGRV